jgi:ribA/ribD-fused uncharacterized protein
VIETFVVDGEHSFLSNFYESLIVLPWTEQVAKSGEHAYQSMKAVARPDASYVLEALTPAEAKRRGRLILNHPQWQEQKLIAMRTMLKLKFLPDSELAAKLLRTGDHYLQEGNTWGDRFWGVDETGQNWLGHLLMARRAELRSGAVS